MLLGHTSGKFTVIYQVSHSLHVVRVLDHVGDDWVVVGCVGEEAPDIGVLPPYVVADHSATPEVVYLKPKPPIALIRLKQC